ncbi:MAG: fluoride efflux transporter CrcB [Pseudomonadota bacterium]
MPVLVQIALGGALGALLRFAVVSRLAVIWPGAFPVGVLTVNVLGSFAMGLIVAVATARSGGMLASALPFLTIGLMGGFTTFSAFSLDTLRLIEEGETASAMAYVAGSVAFSVFGLWLGLTLGRSFAP